MKVLIIARKYLLEMLREMQLLALELGMPLLFLVITLVMYNSPLLITHPVGVKGPMSQTQDLIDELQAQQYADGRPVFAIQPVDDLTKAEAELKDKQLTALLVYDPGTSSITMRGDAISATYYRASVMLEAVLRRYGDSTAGQGPVIQVAEQSLIDAEAKTGGRLAAGPQTLFDFYAPGIIVFAILMIIPQTAMLLSREIRLRTLRRLRLTPLNAWELLSGVSLAQLAVALVQVVTVFLCALALGFHNQGSLLLAILVGMVLSISAIGMGLAVAPFAENDSQAANIGATLTMVEVFLSGSWFSLPAMTLFTIGGHAIDVFDIFPATSGFMALQQVLVYGAGLGEIAFRLGVTLLVSGFYFVIGILVFQRLQMRRA